MLIPPVLALDIEGTLVSNGVSQFPREGLYAFLEGVRALFPRVVIYTGLSEERARAVMSGLAAEGLAPGWVVDLEFVHWDGRFKDLGFVPDSPGGTWLVDDMREMIHPDQEDGWISISPFVAPYGPDAELSRVLDVLRSRLAGFP